MTIMIPAWVDGTLMPVEKLEVHKRGLRHKAISVFVFCGDELLLQRRAPGKYHTPGLWSNTCCSHPDWGESASDCAKRRLDEELRLTALNLGWKAMIEYRTDVGEGLIEHERVDVFVARVPERVAVSPDPEEVSETNWVQLRSLKVKIDKQPERYTPWLAIYLRDFEAQIFH